VRAVNLLPREEPKRSRKQPAAPVLTGLVAGLLVVVVLGGGFFLTSAKVAQKQTDVDAAHAELALIPAPQQPDPVALTLASQEGSRTAAVQQALNGRLAWDHVLTSISRVLPRDVWLSSLTLQAPTATADPTAAPTGVPPPATAAASTFTMDGNAFSHEGVARLLTRLALVPDLDNVKLVTSSRTTVGKHGAVQFSLVASVRTSGAGS